MSGNFSQPGNKNKFSRCNYPPAFGVNFEPTLFDSSDNKIPVGCLVFL